MIDTIHRVLGRMFRRFRLATWSLGLIPHNMAVFFMTCFVLIQAKAWRIGRVEERLSAFTGEPAGPLPLPVSTSRAA